MDSLVLYPQSGHFCYMLIQVTLTHRNAYRYSFNSLSANLNPGLFFHRDQWQILIPFALKIWWSFSLASMMAVDGFGIGMILTCNGAIRGGMINPIIVWSVPWSYLRSSGYSSPAGSPDVFTLIMFSKEFYIKCFLQSSAEEMRSACLQCFAILHHGFNAKSIDCTCKTFTQSFDLWLRAWRDGLH